MWYAVAPKLVDRYTVVAPDLRSYGRSSKPTEISDYTKSVMALDMVNLMKSLGFDSFFVCGHDRGARVTHKMCVDHPDRVLSTIILDICPTLAMYGKTDFTFAKSHFHWFFLIQPEPLPEAMILGNPRKVGEFLLGGLHKPGVHIFDKECFEYYLSVLEDHVAVHGMCNDYRAASSLNLDEQRADLKAGRKVKCPLRIVWGDQGIINKQFDAFKDWRAVATDPSNVDGYGVKTSNYIPE